MGQEEHQASLRQETSFLLQILWNQMNYFFWRQNSLNQAIPCL
jgi:hypothetical protein